ncbi:membrane transporter [Oryctes borbonicus]|uniref:Membrane transporter n=1 Tax=Oryctes borbonicus TaxID=1629725 RepID=A0A0T6BBS7_9SCAR|nr:membrane transporter [Oryctes borbonicus]
MEQASWLASFGAITNPIGAIISGLLAEWCGRRRSMQFSSIPFLIGWICIGLAEDIDILYTGRLITGIASGMATASYTYVTEISTPKTRGIFQALGPVSASFGILLTYTLGYFLDWKIVALISCTFSFFTLITLQLLPESPSYLHHVNRKEEALKSLTWFRRNIVVAQDEFAAMKLAGDNLDGKDFVGTFCSPTTLKPFAILVVFFFLQEASGIYAILFYAVDFFKDAQVNFDEHISSIIVGGIRFLMSIFGAILINKYGRRLLCMISSCGMSLSMLGIVIYFEYFALLQHDIIWPTIPLICVISNVFFSMIGMLPIPWILVGELFPTRVRSVMGGIIICLAQIFIFLSVKFYPDLIYHIKFSGTCGVFLTASIIALLFSKFILPETKNKTLEEIEDHMRKKTLFGIENKGFSASEEDLEQNRLGRSNVYTIQMT